MSSYPELDELEANGSLTKGENRLVSAARSGAACIFSGPHPIAESQNVINEWVLRKIVRHGFEFQTAGFALSGAHIVGELNLDMFEINYPIFFDNCTFDDKISLIDTRCGRISFRNSILFGVNAQRLQTKSGLDFISCTCVGKFELSNAKIEGDIDCYKSIFQNSEGFSLFAQSAKFFSSVYMRRATFLGETSFAGAKIDGQFSCENAKFINPSKRALNAQGVRIADALNMCSAHFHGEANFSGSNISGQFSSVDSQFMNPNGMSIVAQAIVVESDAILDRAEFHGDTHFLDASIKLGLSFEGAIFNSISSYALNAQEMKVGGGLIWKNIRVASGAVTFAAAKVGTLSDDEQSWQVLDKALDLESFTYDRIIGGFTDLGSRLAWLERGSYSGGSFSPQPYTQLASVYKSTGHDSYAKRVLIERDRRIRAQAYVDMKSNEKTGALTAELYRLWSSLLGIFAGYGYAPGRSLLALLGLIVIGWALSYQTWHSGDFAPNAAPILVSEGWQKVVAQDCIHTDAKGCDPNPAATWSAKGAPGMDWESFNSFAYAADIVIPIVDIGQTQAWAPAKDRGPWGFGLWWGRWVFTGLGWFFTALGAAAVTGLIRRD